MQKFIDLPGAFVTGSSLVIPSYQDIDIVVPLSSWNETNYVLDKSKNYVPNSPKEYMSDPTIHSTHRSGQYNIIVVLDEYIEPWVTATNIMLCKRDFYGEKSARVALFERIKTRFLVEKEYSEIH